MADDGVLQIVHISDTHHYAPRPGEPGPRTHQKHLIQLPAKLRRVSRLTKAPRSLRDYLAQEVSEGFQVHDREATRRFEAAFAGLLDDWPEAPTWLVHTGDLTTWGDRSSVEDHLRWLESLVEGRPNARLFVLHGNHDYWPDGFPLLARPGQINAQVQWLRGTVFSDYHIERRGTLDLGGDRRIVLVPLSTSVYERVRNTLAQGRGWNDVKYDTVLRRQHQIGRLQAILKDGHRNGERSIRIGLLHHPLSSGAYDSRWDPSKRIINGAALAEALGDKLDLILSGHTHATYPATENDIDSSPFRELELVVGSLSQRKSTDTARLRNDSALCHQCQVLRFYQTGDDTLGLRRHIYRRRGNEGDYTRERNFDLAGTLSFSRWP